VNINTNKLNPGSVTSYDLRPGNGVGPYSGRDRRRDRREGKMKKGRKKTNRKGKQRQII